MAFWMNPVALCGTHRASDWIWTHVFFATRTIRKSRPIMMEGIKFNQTWTSITKFGSFVCLMRANLRSMVLILWNMETIVRWKFSYSGVPSFFCSLNSWSAIISPIRNLNCSVVPSNWTSTVTVKLCFQFPLAAEMLTLLKTRTFEARWSKMSLNRSSRLWDNVPSIREVRSRTCIS